MVSQLPSWVTECSLSGGPNELVRSVDGESRVAFHARVSLPEATRLLIIGTVIDTTLVLVSLPVFEIDKSTFVVCAAMYASRYW